MRALSLASSLGGFRVLGVVVSAGCGWTLAGLAGRELPLL